MASRHRQVLVEQELQVGIRQADGSPVHSAPPSNIGQKPGGANRRNRKPEGVGNLDRLARPLFGRVGIACLKTAEAQLTKSLYLQPFVLRGRSARGPRPCQRRAPKLSTGVGCAV